MRSALRWLLAISAVLVFCYVGELGALMVLLFVSFVMVFVPKPFSVGYVLASWLYFAGAFSYILVTTWGRNPDKFFPFGNSEKLPVRLLPMGMFVCAMIGGFLTKWLASVKTKRTHNEDLLP